MLNGVRIGATVLAIAAYTLHGSGCAEQEAQVYYIAGNQAVDESSNCELQLGGQTAFRASGTLDLSMSDIYVLFPLIESGIPKTEEVTGKGPPELLADNSTVLIKGAILNYQVDPIIEAEIQARTGVTLPQDKFVYSAGSVEANKNTIGSIEVVTSDVGQLLQQAQLIMGEPYQSAELLVSVVLEGQLQDGTVVYSNEFTYPITICNQCLLYFPVPDCTDLTLEPEPVAPCFPGQDDAIDCRICYILADSEADAQKCLNQN